MLHIVRAVYYIYSTVCLLAEAAVEHRGVVSKAGTEGTLSLADLEVNTIADEQALLLELLDLLRSEVGETPLLGEENVLATRELVGSTAESLTSLSLEHVLGSDGEKDLVNVDTSDETLGLTVSTTHTSLKTIGTSAGKHAVNTDDVVGVDTDTEVEVLTTSVLAHVLVDNDTSSFESVGGDLLVLTGDEVNADGETESILGTVADIVNLDLSIRHTTEVARLDVRLVLAVAVATSRTTTHMEPLDLRAKAWREARNVRRGGKRRV